MEKKFGDDKERMLKELIKKGESESLELKPSLSQINEIIETVAAFANAKGGKVIIGVSNRGEVLGLKIGKDTIEKLTNKILASLEPKIYPSISVKEIERKQVIVISVEEAKEKPVFAFGRAYKRVGRSTLRMSKNEIERVILEKRRIYWDEQICEDASLEDIDEKKVEWYLERREEIRKVKKPREMDLETLLINIKAAREVNGKVKPTNAGILFFGKNPQRFILQSQLRLARFAGKELSRDFLDRLDCSGTLWEMVEQAEDFIRRNIRLFGFRTEFTFRRIDKLEYPLKAIREGIINALIHRNYEEPSDTRVMIFDDRIEIVNPGSFPKGATPDNPRHVPVNPTLCQLMYDVGFIEKYGTGIFMMKELCREYGIHEPVYELSEYETKLIFKSGGKAVLIAEIEKLGIQLNERQKNALRYAFREGFITNKIYREINKVSHELANRELSQLVELGLLKVKGKGRATKYIPKS